MPIILAQRVVDNPSLTDGLAHGEKPERYLKETVTENILTRLGALCYIRKRELHHERAAEKFKSDYEAIYGGMGSAVDPSRVQVDTTIIAHDSGMAARIDRGRSIRGAMEFLGKDKADLLIATLVLSVPAGEGLHWRERAKATQQVLDVLDELCELYQLKARAA